MTWRCIRNAVALAIVAWLFIALGVVTVLDIMGSLGGGS